MRRAGLVPALPCLISVDVEHPPGPFIDLVVPENIRAYRLNWSPVAGLECVILFGTKTTHATLFETYQSLYAVGVKSILAKLHKTEYWFHLYSDARNR